MVTMELLPPELQEAILQHVPTLDRLRFFVLHPSFHHRVTPFLNYNIFRVACKADALPYLHRYGSLYPQTTNEMKAHYTSALQRHSYSLLAHLLHRYRLSDTHLSQWLFSTVNRGVTRDQLERLQQLLPQGNWAQLVRSLFLEGPLLAKMLPFLQWIHATVGLPDLQPLGFDMETLQWLHEVIPVSPNLVHRGDCRLFIETAHSGNLTHLKWLQRHYPIALHWIRRQMKTTYHFRAVGTHHYIDLARLLEDCSCSLDVSHWLCQTFQLQNGVGWVALMQLPC